MPGDKQDKPPNPYPEPRQGEPSELGEKVDWMTYSHQELYDMVHTGVDLTSAASVKDGWTTLGTTLAEVKDQLISAVFASSSGWEGESAEKARDGLLTVVKWAENTSDHATNVAECINLEIEHVVTAREQMPKPAPAPTPVAPVDQLVTPTTTPVAPVSRIAVDALTPVDPADPGQLTTRSPFTGIDQVGAPVVAETAAVDAGHRAAADVMAAFQQGSFAVDQTVPAFSAPVNPVAAPEVLPGTGGAPSPTTRVDGSPVVVANPTTGAPVAGRTATSSGSGHRSGGGGAGGGGGYAPAARGGYSAGGYSGAGQSSGGGGAGGSSSPITPGGSSGVIGGTDSRASSAQTSTSQAPKVAGGAAVPGGMMGAPMAAGPLAGRDDETGHRRARYLEEDDNLFGVDKKAAPPVIGT
ncbi:PPE domain-containing protein [Umezawaea sp.]|uniref:PPE domain-containing protein n=1 Tax=Umezawaea sp. TaxID=1955258 RepID=UPI002ED5F42C